MKFAIMESILTSGGHEVDFDRILVEELNALGHEVNFYVPEQYVFKYDYGTKINYLSGASLTYEGIKGLKKLLASARKELNRQRWYRGLYAAAKRQEFDAIIIPTSTYRYLRALRINPLKNSPVPVLFIVHGVNSNELPRFCHEMQALTEAPNIRIAVISTNKQIEAALASRFPRMFFVDPPVYTARDLAFKPEFKFGQTVNLGFFGQYRREKNLDAFLDVFVSCAFTYPVSLTVQGATIYPADAQDFARIIKKYEKYSNITFLHKSLIGKAWQEAIAEIDALIMPYGAERYLYHWSAMLFTAIGYYKPVLISSVINPEVLSRYNIGLSFAANSGSELKLVLEQFVNTFPEKAPIYEAELKRANEVFSPAKFAQQLVRCCNK